MGRIDKKKPTAYALSYQTSSYRSAEETQTLDTLQLWQEREKLITKIKKMHYEK